jgi:hypothetical protein
MNAADVLNAEGSNVVDVALHEPFKAVVDAEDLAAG